MKMILRYYVRLAMLLLPVAFLPVVNDPFGFGKNWLLMTGALLGVVLVTLGMAVEKKGGFKSNKILVLMGLMTVWGWLGWLRLAPGARMLSITEMGGVGTVSALLGWLFVWLQTDGKEEREKQLGWLTAGGLIAAAVSVTVFMVPTSRLPLVWPRNNPVISINSVWSLTGSLISEILLVGFLLLEWGKRLYLKMKGEGSYLMAAIVTAVLMLIVLLDGFRIFKAGVTNLDGTTAWIVAAETFKRQPIWGIGPGNFIQAFSSYRPTSFNLTPVWTSSFGYSSSAILQLWTELGLVGLVIGLLMLGAVLRSKRSFDWVILVVMMVVVAWLPVNLLGLIIMVWLAGGSLFEEKKVWLELKMGEPGMNVAPWMAAVVVAGMAGFCGYQMYRILMGEVFFRESLAAAAKNDGTGTYNLQIRAIAENSWMAQYRVAYSQTNLALATSVLTSEGATEEDRQKASVLIQQAVREAKAAISLNNNNPGYWTNLASIYRQLTGVVDGSADWSFEAYQQAALLEPANPMIKLELGGLLYAAGRYGEADRIFEQTVMEKQDFANGWYNWAWSAKKMGKLDEAVQRIGQAVALVPVDSGDYNKATDELAAWKKELEVENAKNKASGEMEKPAETLKTAEPLPTIAEEKVEVSESDFGLPPMEEEVTVTPTEGIKN